jgi:chromosome segregation ATPase
MHVFDAQVDAFTARSNELAIQLKTARSEVEMVKQELHEYKEKATRILQSKDKLISSLKEGGLSSSQDGTSAAEYEEILGERDLLKEEVQHMQMTIENLRQEIGVSL